MAKLEIKRGTFKLHAQYQDVKLRFTLQGEMQEFGLYEDMWLTAEEWDRLVKWVEFQRADERIGQHEATP